MQAPGDNIRESLAPLQIAEGGPPVQGLGTSIAQAAFHVV